MNLEALLSARLAAAFEAVAGRPVDPAVRVSQHADFQSNAALGLAAALGRPPREIATAVAAGLDGVEVSGPGFLNLTVPDDLIVSGLEAMDDRLGVPVVAAAERIVVDYSGPNIAKELQVGHLRSTIIGDAIARILEWQGHEVVRVNHVGDWGTPFAMLIEHIDAAGDYSLSDLTELYRRARVRFDSDEDFRERARLRVVALQNGDPASRELWRRLVAQSFEALLFSYGRLGVTLGASDFVGESFYQDRLAGIVDELAEKGLLVESDGALCVFPPGFTGRDGEPLPLIVRKSDGGFGYAATDLAAVRYRAGELGAQRILYVVGAPQRTHFRMVFAVARMAGWLPPDVTAEHIEFGSILGTDGKMLRTRAGAGLTLESLLDESAERASSPEIGLAAIKYADLSSDRRSDYVFDWDRMLAASGNTGPYLQYAYARIRSLSTRAGSASATGPIMLTEPAERDLALAVLAFEPAVAAAGREREPHRLAAYLHDLAVTFSTFYEKCPILRATPELRASRLALAARTAETLQVGCSLLGIELPTEM